MCWAITLMPAPRHSGTAALALIRWATLPVLTRHHPLRGFLTAWATPSAISPLIARMRTMWGFSATYGMPRYVISAWKGAVSGGVIMWAAWWAMALVLLERSPSVRAM